MPRFIISVTSIVRSYFIFLIFLQSTAFFPFLNCDAGELAAQPTVFFFPIFLTNDMVQVLKIYLHVWQIWGARSGGRESGEGRVGKGGGKGGGKERSRANVTRARGLSIQVWVDQPLSHSNLD